MIGVLTALDSPIVLAPMAGGPTTPELVAAVSGAGGFGFVAGGYLDAHGLGAAVAAVRERTARPFGVNLFLPGERCDAGVERYRARLVAAGFDPGEPVWDDDAYPDKLALLLAVIAESDSTAAPGAWEALQHAVSLNPDDVQLLAAYGRTRALVERTQAVTEAPPEPFTVSAVAVQVAEAGGLSLSVEASGLPLSPDGRARYRVTIEVLDPAGERVPLRPAAAPDSAPTAALELERGADSPSVAERIALLLARSQPGTHTVRVRVTSLASGRSVTRTAAFEIR